MIGFGPAVGHGIRLRTLAGMTFLAALAGLAGGGMVCAQGPSDPPQPPPAAPGPLQQEEATKNVAAPCVEPPPMVRLEDYDGPLKKVVGTFARPLERKAVHAPHSNPAPKLATPSWKINSLCLSRARFTPQRFSPPVSTAGLTPPNDRTPVPS